jgi:O-antigen/teichoic acid export membrane protein
MASEPASAAVAGPWAAALGVRLSALMAVFRGADRDATTRRAALFGVAARVFNAGVVFLTHVLLARLLGVEAFGVFSLAMTWALALGVVAALGLTMTPQRFVPEYRASGDWARLRGLFRFGHGAPLLTGLVIAGVGALLALWLVPADEAGLRLAILIALLALPALALIDVVEGVALAHEWTGVAYGVMFVLRPLLLPVLLALGWLAGLGLGPAAALAGFAAAAWIAALVLVLLVAPRLRALYPPGERAYEPRRWLALAIPALLADGAFLTMAYADVLVLSAFAGAAEVGVYVAATKIVGLVAFIHFGLSYAAAHHFSALHAEGRADDLLAYARRAATWTFWPSLLLAGALAALSPWLMPLFGADFAAGAAIAPLLAAALALRAVIGPSEQLLMMTNRQSAVTRAYGLAALVNVALAVGLAPVMGGLGVALALALATALATGLTALSVRRALGGWVVAGWPGSHSAPRGRTP